MSAISAERRYESFKAMRKYKERRRHLIAKLDEEKKRLPDVIKKLVPNPLNPDQDCFAMTLEVGRLYSHRLNNKPLVTGFPKPKIPDSQPQCLDMKHLVFIKGGEQQLVKALLFYEEAFGAKHLKPKRKRGAHQDIPFPGTFEVRIGSDVFSLSAPVNESSPPSSSFFSLMTNDVEVAVQKAVKAGATVSGKLVQVYSYCQIWCSVVKVNDPYSHVWIIYNKLCPSCLQSFMLLA